jgi:hypothetical protein
VDTDIIIAFKLKSPSPHTNIFINSEVSFSSEGQNEFLKYLEEYEYEKIQSIYISTKLWNKIKFFLRGYLPQKNLKVRGKN